MTKALESAIEKVRKLPPERQDDAAAVLETFAAIDAGDYRLTSEQEAAVRAAIARADTGEYANQEAVEALFRKLGV